MFNPNNLTLPTFLLEVDKTKKFLCISFSLVLLLTTLVAPALGAGANQGVSVDDEFELVPDWINFVPDRASADFPGQPLPQLGQLTSTNYTSGFLSYDGGSITVYTSSDDQHTVLEFCVEGDTNWLPYYVTSSADGTAWYRSTTGQNGSISLGDYDSVTGLYYRNGVSRVKNTFPTPHVPVFASLAAGLHQAANYLESLEDTGAVLVPDDSSFEFNSDYSVDNTSGVDIAVASYNLGYNDIIVVACYETVVVPGTIAGMNANYNVNTSAREFHIPIRYTTVVSDTTFSTLTPFESLEDAVSACYDLLQDSPNHGGGYTPTEVSFRLDPGNVAYIEMADLNQTVTLGATFSSYSALFQSYGSYFPGNQLYKAGMNYPQVGDILPGATPNQIPWQKSEWGAENILGQTKTAVANITVSSNLLMIYNPYYRGDDSGASYTSGEVNPAIIITSSGIARNGVRVYNLKDHFSTVNDQYYFGIGSSLPTDDYYQSQNDPNASDPSITGWTDKNGDPTTAPGVTPYNSPPENDSLADVISGFISNITGLFTAGHDAIKTLAENAAEFVSHLGELYSWLPSQVLAVLTSAIILAIIIGLLKVFL